MKKKLILWLMVMALLIGLSCVTVLAADVGVSLTLSDTEAERGDTLTLTVSLSGENKMKSVMVIANFDSDALELVSGEWLINGDIRNFDMEMKGGVFASFTELDTQGDIFRFTFKVKDAAAISSTSISCTVDLKNGENSLPLGTISPVSLTVICEHTYGEWEKSSETQHKRVCGKCGNEEFADHTWDEGEVTTEPTCKDTGIKIYTCTVCGETKTETVSVTDEHTWGEWEKVDETNHKHTCSVCGKEETAAHTWDEGEVTTDPTHTEFGVRTYTCTACGESKTEQVDKLPDHTYGAWEKYDETQHKRTCACGDVQYADHTWDDGEITTEPTCKDTGIKTYTCTVCGETKTESVPVTDEHTWGSWEKVDETNHKHICSVCGREETAAHTWGDGEVTTEPTCKDTGIMTYTCTACGETKTETVPVTDEHTWGEWEIADETQHKHTCSICGKEEPEDHTWDEGTVTIEPSGGKEGETTYTCTACGATRTEVIPPNHVHSYSAEWRYDGTMHWHACSCGSKKGTQSHAWDDGTVQKEATCTEPGSVLYTCTVCGATKSESVSAEHTPGEWTVVTEASCTGTGKQEQRCTVCGTVLKEMTIAATGHTAGAWQEEDGERVRKCTVCGEVLEREAIQTETTSATESTETTQSEQPTETTEPTDTTALGDDPGEGSSTALIVILIVVGVAVIAVVVVLVVKKKSKG